MGGVPLVSAAEADVLPASAMAASAIVPNIVLKPIRSFVLAVSGAVRRRRQRRASNPFSRLRGRVPPIGLRPCALKTGGLSEGRLRESTVNDQFIGETLCICDIQLHDP